MNTTNFKQMKENDLDQINGGLLITGTMVATGIGAGATFGLATGGWTAASGAFVGAHVGTIAGSLICIGGMLGN